MRLLHASRKEIKSFDVDGHYPPYAILSHTWGEEEISFQDWQGTELSQLQRKECYQKISYCRAQALQDGFEWVWIDTCCIDKTSSAELSESINSMFRWYQNSAACYAYLSDVSRDTPLTLDSEFSRSRWHTRGWTLQELIAPTTLFFYSKDWSLLGTKRELSNLIYSITHIESKFLDSENLDLASAAKKMSWASNRSTSRVEDIAYSLLGIFGINMPLIYGEGKNAFRRLQEEIIKIKYDDHSIFAWGTEVSRPSIEITDEKILWEKEDLTWSKPTRLLGLLAESPRDFADSGTFVPSPLAYEFYRHTSENVSALPVLAGSEIRIQLPVVSRFDSIYHWEELEVSQIRVGIIAVLLCYREHRPTELVCIPLQPSTRGNCGRTNEFLCAENSNIALYFVEDALKYSKLLYIAPEKRREARAGDIILQRHSVSPSISHSIIFKTRLGVTFSEGGRVVTANHGHSIYDRLIMFIYSSEELGENLGFGLDFARLDRSKVIDGLPGSDSKLYVTFRPDVSFSEQDNAAEKLHRTDLSCDDHHKSLTKYFQSTAQYADTWRLDCIPFPFTLQIRVKRKSVGSSFVDVVDIYVEDRE